VARFLRDESGATAIEYSLIATIMAVGLIAAMPVLSTGIRAAFTTLAGNLNVFP
jgi:pilus assembly protein Flp/PilA